MNAISNSVQLIGNLGREVEYRKLDNGNTVARVSLATKEIFRDSKGNRKSETTWHQLVGWGKVAENMQVFLKTGSSVVIQGQLKNRRWGSDKIFTEVVVNQFRLMG